MSTSTVTRARAVPRPQDVVPFAGPGSWSAAKVAGFLATGTSPARMRQVIARWPHPDEYAAALRAGGAAFLEAGWPQVAAPLACPPRMWMALAGTPDYPAHLSHAPAAPLVLFGVGDASVLHSPGLGVAGSRDVSGFGTQVATTAVGAAPVGTPVVAGLALGADTVAHTTALAQGLACVGVIATGPDQLSAPANVDLARQIVAAGGAVITEQPFGTGADTAPARTPAPLAARLVARNRIIAGLSAVVVLAEATGRSGSMHTIWATLEMGRPVIVAQPRAGAARVPGMQAPLALASDAPRTRDQLIAMGAPAAVADRYAGQAPLAHAVATDRGELALLVSTAVTLHATALADM